MIIVTQAQLRNKDTEAIILLRNEIKAKFNTNAIDYFTISAVADFGEVVQCNGYVDKKDFYKHSSKRKGYVIPYNFPLNTRRGFRIIYFLMKLSQHDMTTVIKDIIDVRHAGINFILNVCDKLEKENDCMLTSLRGG